MQVMRSEMKLVHPSQFPLEEGFHGKDQYTKQHQTKKPPKMLRRLFKN
jgi:hypothetical protein